MPSQHWEKKKKTQVKVLSCAKRNTCKIPSTLSLASKLSEKVNHGRRGWDLGQ